MPFPRGLVVLLALGLGSKVWATSWGNKVADASQDHHGGSRAHLTGRRVNYDDFPFQQAVSSCEHNLGLATFLNRELTAKAWPETMEKPLSAAEIESLAQHFKDKRVPFELMATDFSPVLFQGDQQAIYHWMKEIWVVTDFHLAHHYPGQGPTIVEPEETWEHQRLLAAVLGFYGDAYSPKVREMVEEIESKLPRHRKKILAIRQPEYPIASIYSLNPDITAKYIATASLFDASQDPNGPRPGEDTFDYESPIERILSKAGRGKNVLRAISALRDSNPFVPIFELGNFVSQCEGTVNQILCGFLIEGWFIHQYLQHHSNGYLLAHTMKESTTSRFEDRFGFSREKTPGYVMPVFSNDDPLKQVFVGEHVFLMPIREAVINCARRQLRLLKQLAAKLPGYQDVYEKHRAYYEENLRF
jgi:hypothetical protein